MIVEYVSVRSGKVLDRITIDGTSISYETGKARQVVEDLTRRVAVDQLPGWSNGYAQLRLAQ